MACFVTDLGVKTLLKKDNNRLRHYFNFKTFQMEYLSAYCKPGDTIPTINERETRATGAKCTRRVFEDWHVRHVR